LTKRRGALNCDKKFCNTDYRSQEEGKAVPEEAVLTMKANFVLPDVSDAFSDIWFTDLPPQVKQAAGCNHVFHHIMQAFKGELL
jgi:hypothetical protein